MSLAEVINIDLELLLLDVVVLFVLRTAWKSLPWETTSQKVQQYVSDCLKIVSSRLFVANVRIDTSVSGSSCKVLPLSEWDMLSI